MISRHTIWNLSVLVIFFICAVIITYPLILHMGSVSTGRQDELLIAWIHASVRHNLLTNPLQLFEGNIFFPYHNSLAFSDIFLTTTFLTWPFVLLSGQPIIANNIVILSSLILLGYASFLLTEYITKSKLLGLLSGILLIFSPAILDKEIHIQILASYFVLFSFYFLFKYIDSQKRSYLLLSLLYFLLQTYNSIMPGYFIVIGYIVTFITVFFTDRKLFFESITTKVVVLFLGTGLLLLPVVLPYQHVSREFGYVRDIRDTIHFALQPEDLYFPSSATRLEPLLRSVSTMSAVGENKVGYLGGVFSILTLMSLVVFFRTKKKSYYLTSLFVTGIVGLILSFGPFLHLGRQTIHHPFPIPLPYLFFYYVVPGFKAFRASARFEILFILCFASVSGIILQSLLQNVITWKKLVIVFALVGLIFLEFHSPYLYVSIPQTSQFPPVHTYLLSLPKNSTVIEMPIYTWNMQPYASREYVRQYYSTMDFQKRVNGTSGYSPLVWEAMARGLLFQFPEQPAIHEMKTIGVEYIIVHAQEYTTLYNANALIDGHTFPTGSAVIESLNNNISVRLVTHFGSDYVYEVKQR